MVEFVNGLEINLLRRVVDCPLNYTDSQISYAINDFKNLVNLWRCLEKELIDLNKIELAKACFRFIPYQAHLENNNINNIFKY
jgi:ribonuclease D